MPTIHLMQGLPASGKTTFARKLVRESEGRIRRVNLDDLRRMSDGDGKSIPWTAEREKAVTAAQARLVRVWLTYGHDVVVDNTHLYPGQLEELLMRLQGVCEDIRWEVHSLTDVPVPTCLFRDAIRPDSVGGDAILQLNQRYESAAADGWKLTSEWLEGSS